MDPNGNISSKGERTLTRIPAEINHRFVFDLPQRLDLGLFVPTPNKVAIANHASLS
jgi:hypothetical protein